MTLICELNQRVMHIYRGTAGAAMQWGDISGIRVNIQIFGLFWLILGRKNFRPSDFLSNDNRLQRSKLSLSYQY